MLTLLSVCRNGNLDEGDEEDEDDVVVTRRNNESKDANKRRRVSDEGAGEEGLEAGALAIGMDYDLDIDLPSTSAPASNGMVRLSVLVTCAECALWVKCLLSECRLSSGLKAATHACHCSGRFSANY